jgi:hypothetical protein
MEAVLVKSNEVIYMSDSNGHVCNFPLSVNVNLLFLVRWEDNIATNLKAKKPH